MKKILCILFMYCLITFSCLASTPTPTLDVLTPSETLLTLNDFQLPTYKVFGEDYVPVTLLQAFGCRVGYDATSNTAFIQTAPNPSFGYPSLESINLEDLSQAAFQLFDGHILIDQFETHGIIAKGRTLIPIGALRQSYDITIKENIYTLTPKHPFPILATSTYIKNTTTLPTHLVLTDIYYDEGFIYTPFKYELKPSSQLNRVLTPPSESALYITTLINESYNDTLTYSNDNTYGQIKPKLFEMHTYASNLSYSAELGDLISTQDIFLAEQTVNMLGLSSETQYLVWTNIDRQSTFVFEGSKGHWKLIKHFLCSTGKVNSPTPKGTFKLTYKVPYFGIEKGYRCKNAFGFIGTSYLYHSVMFDTTGTYLLKGKGALGTRASAGCIRLSVPHSEWFYNNLITRTTVYID